MKYTVRVTVECSKFYCRKVTVNANDETEAKEKAEERVITDLNNNGSLDVFGTPICEVIGE